MKQNDVPSSVLDYLRHKYDEEFTIVGAIGSAWGQPYVRWGAKPVTGGEDTAFTVFGVPDAFGSYHFADSYFCVLVHDAYETFLQKMLDSVWPGCKLTLSLPRDIPAASDLNRRLLPTEIDQRLHGDTFQARLSIIVPTATPEQLLNLAQSTANQIQQCKLSIWMDFYHDEGKQPAYSVFIDRDYSIHTVQQDSMVAASNAELQIDHQRAMLLSAIVYQNDMISQQTRGSLGDIVRYIAEFSLSGNEVFGALPCEMTREEWQVILNGILADPQLCSLRIAKTVDVTEQNASQFPHILPGHRAVCFLNHTQAVVVFRGTSGDHEWYDNAQGMIQSDTMQQLAARQFVLEARAELEIEHMTVVGHSKGGNKAQYAMLTAPEGDVNNCISLDGQGFSTAFHKKYHKQIENRTKNIAFLAERRDFVNCLGIRAGDTHFFEGWRGDPTTTEPFGNPLPLFHCPDAFFNRKTMEWSPIEEGSIPKTLQYFIRYFLESPHCSDIREQTALDVIQLLMKDKTASNADISQALMNLTVLLVDLVATDEGFAHSITELAYTEYRVLLATFATLLPTNEQSNNVEKSLLSSYLSLLAHEFFINKSFRKNILATLQKLVVLIASLVRDGIHLLVEYLVSFITRLLESLIATAKDLGDKIQQAILSFLDTLLQAWRRFIGGQTNALTSTSSALLASGGDEDAMNLLLAALDYDEAAFAAL